MIQTPDAPELITENGRLLWRFANGKTLPLIRGGADDGEEKKFSQADMDRAIQERIARVKTEPPADYDALKQAKVELDRLKADADAEATKKLTADEATARRIADLEEKVTASAAAVTKAQADALVEKRRSAIVAAAATNKATNADQVAALLDLEAKHKDAVIIGDDGRVTGADEAVKAFLTDNPHFVGNGTAGNQSTPASRHQGKEGVLTPSVSAGRDMFEARRGSKSKSD
jgi:hypothetical protein